MHDIMTNW